MDSRMFSKGAIMFTNFILTIDSNEKTSKSQS